MNAGKNVYTEIYNRALEKMESARLLLENNKYADSVSRAYYAVFHVLTALLLSKGLAFSSHSQVIGRFNKEFVKSGIFPADITGKVRQIFKLRQAGDYSIDPAVVFDEAQKAVSDADEILLRVKADLL